jgi:ABC-2 type transport system permease protein
MKSAEADILEISAHESASQGSVLTALSALFVLTLRQHLRGRRLIVLCVLFILPTVLAVLIKFAPHPPPPGHLEFVLALNLLPSALATLTALLYAAGIVLDEVEEQTLTYLLLRPLPRWALYITKLLATILVTSLLTSAFMVLTMTVIYWDAPDQWREAMVDHLPKTVALLSLAQMGYCSLFGAISLLTRRVLIAGIGYTIVFEGLLANIPILTRQFTVM